jgi:hypothetical protein
LHKQTIYEIEVRTKVVGRAQAARKDEGFLEESFVLLDLICVSLILDWNQWHAPDLRFWGGETNAEGARPSRGVRGHAHPGKF